MGHRYHDLLFSEAVKAIQAERGSREVYAVQETRSDRNAELTASEMEFIAARDSFQMATISETGWPYLQHRGGPPGFVAIIDDRTIAFQEYRGNRQFISQGNIRGNDRTALFFMDSANRRRLKVLGRARLVPLSDDRALASQFNRLGPDVETPFAWMVRVEAFDWNCPKYITPRYTEADIARAVNGLRHRIVELEQENSQLRARLAD